MTTQKSSVNEKINPNSVPSLNITIDDFSWSKAQLGAIKIKSRTSKILLNLESVQIANPQGSSLLSGQWSSDIANGKDHSLSLIHI